MTQAVPPQRAYFPLAELLTGDHFILHPKHIPCGARPVLIKTGRNTIKNAKSGQSMELSDEQLLKTLVTKID